MIDSISYTAPRAREALAKKGYQRRYVPEDAGTQGWGRWNNRGLPARLILVINCNVNLQHFNLQVESTQKHGHHTQGDNATRPRDRVTIPY